MLLGGPWFGFEVDCKRARPVAAAVFTALATPIVADRIIVTPSVQVSPLLLDVPFVDVRGFETASVKVQVFVPPLPHHPYCLGLVENAEREKAMPFGKIQNLFFHWFRSKPPALVRTDGLERTS